MKDLKAELEQRKAAQLYRHRRISDSPQQIQMRIDGQDVINFCSNDYLGLANHPQVRQSFQNAANEFGTGSGAAHLINGHSRYHHALEVALAEFTGQQRALLFSTGYMANLGISQSLMSSGDAIFADRLNHASLLDGARLSNARLSRYPHRDTANLQTKLERSQADHKLIMSDSVFSMDGDIALLPELFDLAETHQTWLLIDDAHALGVIGKTGRGSLEHFDIPVDDRVILMGTLGKALGTAGAFVAGSEDLIEYLIQTARSYIYTTAMPSAIAAATLTSLKIIENEPERQQRLIDNITYFRRLAKQENLSLMDSETAIHGLLLGSNEDAVAASEMLWNQGFMVTAIRPPTVPNGTARLRITLSADHQHEHIGQLVAAIHRAY